MQGANRERNGLRTSKQFASLLLLVLTLSSCEVDLKVVGDGKNPPTFKLSGSGNLERFLVMEVPHENQKKTIQRESDRNILLWEIKPPADNDAISRIPAITYGKLPPGFVQVFPANGASPPSLAQGKIYEVGGTAYNANGGQIWIKVNDGKTLEIPIPGSRPEVVQENSPKPK